MDLKQQLLKRNSKENWNKIAAYCIEHPNKIQDIIKYCSDKEKRIQQNASAVLNKLIDFDDSIIDPYTSHLVELLKEPLHDSVKRSVLRSFQKIELEENVAAELINYVFEVLPSNAPIAIKAFGMTAARKVCEKYPELANELVPAVEMIIEKRESPGLINRGKKELTKLYQVISKNTGL